MTAGGIIGKVKDIKDDRVTVESGHRHAWSSSAPASCGSATSMAPGQ